MSRNVIGGERERWLAAGASDHPMPVDAARLLTMLADQVSASPRAPGAL